MSDRVAQDHCFAPTYSKHFGHISKDRILNAHPNRVRRTSKCSRESRRGGSIVGTGPKEFVEVPSALGGCVFPRRRREAVARFRVWVSAACASADSSREHGRSASRDRSASRAVNLGSCANAMTLQPTLRTDESLFRTHYAPVVRNALPEATSAKTGEWLALSLPSPSWQLCQVPSVLLVPRSYHPLVALPGGSETEALGAIAGPTPQPRHGPRLVE